MPDETTPTSSDSAKSPLKVEAMAKGNHADQQLVTFCLDGACATVNAQDVLTWLASIQQLRVGSNNKASTEISAA